jgi:hypothetical protein
VRTRGCLVGHQGDGESRCDDRGDVREITARVEVHGDA